MATVSLIVRLVDQLSGAAGKVVSSVKGIGRSFDDTARSGSRLDRIVTRLAAATLATDGLNRIAGRMGTALSGSVRGFADFENMLDQIRVTGGATDADIKGLSDSILRIAPRVGRTADEISRVAAGLVQAGVSIGDTTSMLDPILRAAVAAGAEATDVQKAAIAIRDNLKVPADQLLATFDQVLYATKQGKIEFRDFAKIMPSLGAAAARFGLKGAEGLRTLAAAAEIVGQVVKDPSTVGVGLSDLMTKATMPEAEKKFKKLGVDIRKELAKAVESGGDPLLRLLDIYDRLKLKRPDLKPSDLFADKEALSAFDALINNRAELLRIMQGASEASGTVERDFARMASNTKSAFDQLNASGDALSKTWGSLLAPAAAAAARGVGALADGVKALITDFPMLGKVLSFAAGGFVAIGSAITGASSLLIGLAAIVTILRGTAIGAAIAAFGRGLLMLALLPLRFASVAVQAMAGFVRGFASGLVGGLAQTGLFALIRSWWARLMMQVAGLGLNGSILAAVMSSKIGSAITGAGASIAATLAGITAPMWAAIAGILAAVAALAFGIYRYWGPIKAFLGGFFGYFTEQMARLASTVAAAVADLAGALAESMSTWFAAMATAVGAGLANLRARIATLWADVTAAIFAAIPDLRAAVVAIAGLFDGIASAIGRTFDAAAEAVRAGAARVTALVRELLSPVEMSTEAAAQWQQLGRSIAEGIASVPGQVVAAVGGMAGNVTAALREAVGDITQRVTASIVVAPGDVMVELGDIGRRVADAVRERAGNVVQRIVAAFVVTPGEVSVDGFTDWARRAGARISGAFREIDLTAAGAEIMNSLLRGLTSAAERVMSWVSGWVSRLKSMFNFTVSPNISAPQVPSFAPGAGGVPRATPQSAPGPSLVPAPSPAQRVNLVPGPASNTRTATVVNHNSFRIDASDPDKAARAIVTALDRYRQAGLYDGQLT